MAQPWYYDLYGAGKAGTHAAGDDGEDIGTPDNTPLSFMEGGQVIDASYHVYGGQVVVHLPDGYDEYWIHMNRIFVSPGEEIQPNEIIGTSGGGVGDLILKNGRVQPATSQSDYEGHSTGYHSETGFFEDQTPQGSMAEFNKGWGNRVRQLDPRPMIQRLAAAHPTLFPGPNNSSSTSGLDSTVNGTPQSYGLNIPSPVNIDIGGGLADAGNRLLAALGFSSAKSAFLRIAVGGVGVVLILGSLVVALQPEAEAVGEKAQQAGKKIQKIEQKRRETKAKFLKALVAE